MVGNPEAATRSGSEKDGVARAPSVKRIGSQQIMLGGIFLSIMALVIGLKLDTLAIAGSPALLNRIFDASQVANESSLKLETEEDVPPSIGDDIISYTPFHFAKNHQASELLPKRREKFAPAVVNSEENTSSVLERTSNKAYSSLLDDPQAKYFMYTPSGGWNNQLKEFWWGLEIAKLLNRTLIAPMAAKHTTWWTKYYYLEEEGLMPMDLFLDFGELESRGFSILPLDVTIKQFEAKMKGAKKLGFVKTPKTRVYWSGKKSIKSKMGFYKDTVLFLKGSHMYHKWFRTMPPLPVYTVLIRKIALEIMEELGGLYGAVHIRMGDYAKRGRIPPISSIIRSLKKGNFTGNYPLYIATEPKRKERYFTKFRRNFKQVKFASDFKDITDRFTTLLKPSMVDDMLGLVEQLVCVGAYIFIGTGYSNFSGNIGYMRKTPELHFPEAVRLLEAHGIRKR